mmetsp:Transcript_33145/g.95658  ORF Transcript_33145/g.95658 Transcript_33145/m.95658 type:complete len:314 (-) Transcript_33145:1000-1941(-)
MPFTATTHFIWTLENRERGARPVRAPSKACRLPGPFTVSHTSSHLESLMRSSSLSRDRVPLLDASSSLTLGRWRLPPLSSCTVVRNGGTLDRASGDDTPVTVSLVALENTSSLAHDWSRALPPHIRTTSLAELASDRTRLAMAPVGAGVLLTRSLEQSMVRMRAVHSILQPAAAAHSRKAGRPTKSGLRRCIRSCSKGTAILSLNSMPSRFSTPFILGSDHVGSSCSFRSVSSDTASSTLSPKRTHLMSTSSGHHLRAATTSVTQNRKGAITSVLSFRARLMTPLTSSSIALLNSTLRKLGNRHLRNLRPVGQ